MQTDCKDLECHSTESGLNSVGDGEPWKGFNQASDTIPPALKITLATAGIVVGGDHMAGRPEGSSAREG